MQDEGRLDQARGRIRSTWGDITDDDVDKAQGNTETLVGTIREKTGEAVDAIREKLDSLLNSDGDDKTRNQDASRM
jgi:uncharacterized protein YjbJ (UPF0337 family)